MSTPRSLASLRTGGFASVRTAPGSVAAAGTSAGADGVGSVRADVAGTGVSSASSTSSVCAPPAAKAPCTCIWVAAPASVAGDAAPRRGRRSGPRSALLRPTRLSPSPPPLAAGLERSISISAGAAGAAAGGASPAAPIAMIGVPTGIISPSATIRACTVPANGDGSSTRDLAVSISTMMSLISTVSPTLTFHETISASVRPSPTSGSLNSAMCCSPSQNARVRSTASRTRSRSGRKSSSMREAGYGVSKPPTRSTGDSRE